MEDADAQIVDLTTGGIHVAFATIDIDVEVDGKMAVRLTLNLVPAARLRVEVRGAYRLAARRTRRSLPLLLLALGAQSVHLGALAYSRALAALDRRL